MASDTMVMITSEQIALLNEEIATHKKLHEVLAKFLAHTVWVIVYCVLATVSNPLNPTPSQTDPPMHVIFLIVILIVRDIVQVVHHLHRLLKLRNILKKNGGLERRRLTFPAYREAVLDGLAEGLVASSIREIV